MNWSRVSAIAIIALAVTVSFITSTSFSQGGKGGEGLVGAETCKGCHPDIYDAFKKSPHAKKECEACHGPGAKHAEAEGKGMIRSFKSVEAKDRSDACLSCHEKMKSFFQFGRSVHKLSAVGCNDCHGIHGKTFGKNLLKAKEVDLCFSCHQDVKSKFYLPKSHKVLPGAVKCSDCHSPHGTRQRASLRKTNLNTKEETCLKCHPEKRGPWVYEHLAQKVEGCTACHESHGSLNRFLLIRRDSRDLCAECHGRRHFPNTVCINCHTQIHGSNFSSRFLQ